MARVSITVSSFMEHSEMYDDVTRFDALPWWWFQASAVGVGPGKTYSSHPSAKMEHHEVVCPHIGPVNVFIQVWTQIIINQQ